MSDEPRSLHLHTLASLLADLVSGRAVDVGDGETVSITDERSRSALEWYRKKGPATWAANLSAALSEDLVDAIQLAPPSLAALPARAANANTKRIRLKKVDAHRFAGLHKFGTPGAAPKNFAYEFTKPLTLFEGRNGSGKTSLLNAIIWGLTGELLRPQRAPEAPEDFDCIVDPVTVDADASVHKLSSLTPMPNLKQYRPEAGAIPADTWVELTFVDENDAELPRIRRSLSRTAQGKLKKTVPDLSVLGLDPIAVRIGTIIPGLLPLIKVGSESELGHAVSELTGLSAVIDLAGHAKRTKTKIDKELIKTKEDARGVADNGYNLAKGDIENVLKANENLPIPKPVPPPSAEKTIEATLTEITDHFTKVKSDAYTSAGTILGDGFDPANQKALNDLDGNIAGALERAGQPQGLPSAGKLGALKKVTVEALDAAEQNIRALLAEGAALQAMENDPSVAARTRLYAGVAIWMEEHPDAGPGEDICAVCGNSLIDAIDPVTGKPVKQHLKEAVSSGSLLSQTLARWAEHAAGWILKDLPPELLNNAKADLPNHPVYLLKEAITGELFATDAFKGVLGVLKGPTITAFDEVTKDRKPLADALAITLPSGCDSLAMTLQRLEKAIRFARWTHESDALCASIATDVLGRRPKEGEAPEDKTLTGKLLALQEVVKASKPITDILTQCSRLSSNLKDRRSTEKRIEEYKTASSALAAIIDLGTLADKQVEELQKTLRTKAAAWRDRIYKGAFPDTAHKLVDAQMGRKGELDLRVETGGISAPAQHVTNSSALRASLVSFFFAFWEYVLQERGGLTTLLLDDPQELLDEQNRERMAAAVPLLVKSGAQAIVTSYDARFNAYLSRQKVPGGVDHFEVLPATLLYPTLKLNFPLPEVEKRKALFDADHNNEEAGRNFADSCRVYFEAKLGDVFDDSAYSSWVIANPEPTLSIFVQRLRTLVKAGTSGPLAAHVFKRFVDHSAMQDNSAVLVLMNKSHHGRRAEITATDVTDVTKDLNELLEMVEQMYDESYRWRRRDEPQADGEKAAAVQLPDVLVALVAPDLKIPICPDLAAFTQHSSGGESQGEVQTLEAALLQNKAAFYLRRPNFGFAAPTGAIAIVESVDGPAADRRLVIARHAGQIHARRLVRGITPGMVGLTAEIPDPRSKTPRTLFLSESEVAIHQVTGVIFDHNLTVGPGKDEAVQIDVSAILSRAELAFRIVDESAVPLALPKQIVLGGRRIELNELVQHEDELVAVTLEDGQSLFKRVGRALPGALAHLRQFESIGGLGSSQILSIDKSHPGLGTVKHVRRIFGVLYHG